MKKNKILFIVQLPPPVHGASMVNKILVDNKKIIDIYRPDVLQSQLAYTMEDLGSFSFKKIFAAFFIFFKLSGKLILNRYELVYFTLSPLGLAFYKDAILVFLIKLLSKSKIVIHLHGKGIKNETKSNLKKTLYRLVFKNTKVILLAEVLYDDIKEIYPKKSYILANGITAGIHAISPVDSNKPKITTFIYLSNLMRGKGILIFLESIKTLQPLNNKFRVFIVGPSADITIKEVKQYIYENKISNVEVIGPVYGEDKYNYLLKSDVFVLPTHYRNECFPLSILEAYQSGLAVISTDNGAIPDMIKNGINGYVIQQKNIDELTEKMKFLLDNKDILLRMQSKNKIEFEKKYTEEVFINNFIKIIDEILKK